MRRASREGRISTQENTPLTSIWKRRVVSSGPVIRIAVEKREKLVSGTEHDL